LVAAGGADAVFAPEVDAMYPDGTQGLTWVTVERMGDHLCGARRPGHFRGVATVVAKLFLACRPHVAVFGLKDAQQFFILRRMVADLGFGVRLAGVETVREADGLALSSRNRYLDPPERAEAVVLSRAVAAARELLAGGERDAAAVTARMEAEIAEAPRGRLDYAELVDVRDLQPVTGLRPGMTVLAAAAVHFGRTRLIDNAIVDLR
jgi:pantoate--beta-alanine ligase